MLLLTIAWPVSSQKNSDSIKIHKNDARNAIQAKRENKELRNQVTDIKAKADTCAMVVTEQDKTISDLQTERKLYTSLNGLEKRTALAYKADADAQKKAAKKFKRQRNAVAFGGALAIIAAIIFL